MKYFGEGDSLMARSISGKLPPQNLECERKLLGACLLDNAAIDIAVELVSPEDFYRDSHQRIYEGILEVRKAGNPVDCVSLAEYLTAKGIFEDLGGDGFLGELTLSVASSANAAYHAGVVREKSKARNAIEAFTEGIQRLYLNEETADAVIGNTQTRLWDVLSDQATKSVMGMRDLLARGMTIIQERMEGEIHGIATGFEDLDDMLCGFRPGQLVIVAARPGMGKTAFAMGVALNAGKLAPVLMNSMEMSNDELALRFLSILSGIDSYRFNDSSVLTADERNLLGRAYNEGSQRRIVSDERPARSIAQISAGARRMKAKDGLSLLIIDYLALMGGNRRRGESRQEEVARNSTAVKNLARELNIPIMLLAQLNRKNEERNDKRPMLSDLRESGQIEADADVVIMLHRPEYYKPDDKPGIVEAIVTKNRNGRAKPVELQFTDKCTRFSTLPKSYEERIANGLGPAY